MLRNDARQRIAPTYRDVRPLRAFEKFLAEELSKKFLPKSEIKRKAGLLQGTTRSPLTNVDRY